MNSDATEQFRQLREMAEKLATDRMYPPDPLSPQEIERLIHNLQVHQIELELQNEDLRITQKQLEDSRNRYANLYNNAPVGYVTIDSHSLILQANATFLDMIGIMPSDFHGKTLGEYLLPEDRAVFHARFKAFFKSPEGKSMEFMLQPADGLPFPVIMTGRVNIPETEGEKNKEPKPRLLLILQDIRRQKETEEALRLSQQKLRSTIQEKDLLFSLIAGDLHNMLSSLPEYLDQMPEDKNEISGSDYRHVVMNMRKITSNIQHLLGDLADWARLQQGYTLYRPEILFLSDVVEEAVTGLAAMADQKSIVLVSMIRHDQRVYADRIMLETVARNLLHNAIKFTPRGGRIFLDSSSPDERYCAFYVKDTGIGMEPRIVENLFRPNGQVVRKGTEGEASTGLGLILSKELVEKNNGRIEVESQPGTGTTFTVRLPVKPV